MGTNCAPLIADLFLFCYERDVRSNLHKSKQYDLIDIFNDTSRYLDDIFTIYNPEFEKHISDIYPTELQLNKVNTSDKEISLLDLKLYCGYIYTRTRPLMINHVWGLRQLWLQVNGHAWFHLQGLRRPVRKDNKRKFQNENMSPSNIEPATLWFLAGHLDRFAIETVDYLCFKLVQCSEMTGNAWGVSKHVAIQ